MAAHDRTKEQITRYSVMKNAWAIASMVLFVLDALCVCLFGILPATAVLIIMCILSLAAFGSALMIRDDKRVESLLVIDDPEPINAGSINAGLKKDQSLKNLRGNKVDAKDADARGCYVMSDELNKTLVDGIIKTKASIIDYRLPEFVLPYASELKEARNEDMSRTAAKRPDKRVVGMRSDLDSSSIKDGETELDIIEISRYAAQITDDAFEKIIINRKKVHDRVVFEGRDLAIDEQGRLMNIAGSEIANEIDIQTLIISSDGYPMLCLGTAEHPLHAGRIVASAACSLLPEETVDGGFLQEALERSIRNKINVLFELAPFKVQNAQIRSCVCGFSRIIERGGAPEFYCLTTIPMTRDELIAAHKDPTTTFRAESLPHLIQEPIDLFCQDCLCERLSTIAKSVLFNATNASVAISTSAMLDAISSVMDNDEVAKKICEKLRIGDSFPRIANAEQHNESDHIDNNV